MSIAGPRFRRREWEAGKGEFAAMSLGRCRGLAADRRGRQTGRGSCAIDDALGQGLADPRQLHQFRPIGRIDINSESGIERLGLVDLDQPAPPSAVCRPPADHGHQCRDDQRRDGHLIGPCNSQRGGSEGWGIFTPPLLPLRPRLSRPRAVDAGILPRCRTDPLHGICHREHCPNARRRRSAG